MPRAHDTAGSCPPLRPQPLLTPIVVALHLRACLRAHMVAPGAARSPTPLDAPAWPSLDAHMGTIVSAAAHSPTRCRIASATARNRRHVARIVSKAARNPRLCSDCERAGRSRRRHQPVTFLAWERSLYWCLRDQRGPPGPRTSSALDSRPLEVPCRLSCSRLAWLSPLARAIFNLSRKSHLRHTAHGTL